MERIRNAVFFVLACAIGLRLAWALMQPLVPLLIVLAFLLSIGWLLFRRNG